MRRRVFAANVCALICVAGQSVFAADPPQFWSGRLAGKPQPASSSPSATGAGTPQSPAEQKGPAAANREPEWLRRMDKNDRSTLTGGWGLQNWSGGTQSQTSAGSRSGQYAPNTYQGGGFQQWNNVSTRQDIPGWNTTPPSFPRQMWSQGYVSPNTYYGADAQLWGNMSAGTMNPNAVSGGWTMGR